MKTKLLFTGLAIIAATAMVSAQQENGSGRGKCKSKANGTAYVDKNNNGVCDNSEKTLKNVSMKKRNGTGKCDGTGQKQGNRQGKGKNFADANKNGICDTYESTIKK